MQKKPSPSRNGCAMTLQGKRGSSPGHLHGHLAVIGGHEDKTGNMAVLTRYVELSGKKACIAVVTSASGEPEELWKAYEQVFKSLGVGECVQVKIRTREEAADPAYLKLLEKVDAVFFTGGNQKRLLALLGGTPFHTALHEAFIKRGICIGGTSAGASAMSEHMLFEITEHSRQPQKGMVHLAAGFGFMPRVIVDQHFSERGRLGRLLSVVAQNPYLLGVGIDENTALIVHRGAGIEIVGDGSVTLVDGTQMISNYLDIDEHEHLELLNVRLHLLPNGAVYPRETGGKPEKTKDHDLPPSLIEAVGILGAVS